MYRWRAEVQVVWSLHPTSPEQTAEVTLVVVGMEAEGLLATKWGGRGVDPGRDVEQISTKRLILRYMGVRRL